MPTQQKLIAALSILCFGGTSLAQTAPPPLPSLQQEAEAKIVWGVLLKLIAPVVFDVFTEWAKKKIAARYDQNSLEYLAANSALAAIVSLASYKTGKDIVLAGVAPNATEGTPQLPLRVDGQGENYQGVNVALVSVDANGKPLGFRPLGSGFDAGERFKLRVLSTFDALVVLGNINPLGVSRQIYPDKGGLAVSIPAGKEVLLPLGEKEYFMFSGATGEEKLTFTVRDPRSLESGRAAGAQVYRRDESFGSSFVQAVTPERFPVIAEAIALEHRPARK